MAKVNLSAPWTTCYRQFQAFFKYDPEVKVMYNSNGPELKLLVEDPVKADALTQLLEPSRTFGNVTLKITVVPANKAADEVLPELASDIALVTAALNKNPIVSQIKDISSAYISNPWCYVAFKKEVVQFFNDNLSDMNGLTSTLYQDIANEIFPRHAGVFFCTATGNGLGAPLGEWP